MNKQNRIDALCWLGKNLFELPGIDSALERAEMANPFFTNEFSRLALGSIASWLEKDRLENWLRDVPDWNESMTIGVIMAGNLPLVGWHDLISVFGSGHRCRFKPSSADEILPDFLIAALRSQYPEISSYFEKNPSMKGIDAIVASGSNASAAHFDYYFKNIPRLIRGSKSSLGFIYGFESRDELGLLCDDIMQFFGMGCRSITKILVPEAYDFQLFFESLEKYRYLTHHHRFQNNAIYHKAIFLMNGDSFLENDMLVVRENDNLFSPPGVLNYQFYRDMEEASGIIRAHEKDLQCLVSCHSQLPGSIPFGTAQRPGIMDYADNINTLEFIRKVKPSKA